MTISPITARRAPAEGGEGRRTRLALAIATVGIAATLLAYALSPGVRHAVGHAAHSVKHEVGHVLDPDRTTRTPAKTRGHATVGRGTSLPSHASSSTHAAAPARAKAP